MKNYYEILEINENASPEIIEKAYKVLAKKYHPDVQPPDKKKWAEEKFKEIGEAYEILSDETKKANYDFELASNSSSSEDLRQQNEFLRRNNESLQNEVSSLRRNMQSNSSESYTTVSPDNNFYQDELANQDFISKDEYYADQKAYQDELAKKLYQAQKKAYNDAYIKNLKNMGYKIRYKKTFKTYLKDFLAIILTLLMIFLTGFILWKIPTTHDILLSFYNENPLVRVIVDMIINLFT